MIHAMETAQLRAEWLDWDGSRLRWHLYGDLGGIPATSLNIDGVRFAAYPRSGVGVHEFTCTFPYSPTGHQELSFEVVSTYAPLEPILAPWKVRCSEPAASAVDAWTQEPLGLATLSVGSQLPSVALTALPSVVVVVPIYNSPECVKRCIESVLRWSPRTRLILIDDASTDPAIGAVLAAFAGRANVTIQRNERNRGYTHSVNVGMGLAGGADVVLLNSDTEVGPRWLSALKLAAYSSEDIGTATAVSDNAGAFSVPEIEQHCPIPAYWNLPQAQRAVLQQAGTRYPQLPTGNGFCLYIKRVLLARIGPMDEGAFPQGYGEENDFCQRAELAGYRNLIAGNVLVHHERSASFGDERRAALGLRGMQVLRERYPHYERDVGAMLFSFDRCVLDYRVRRTYAGRDADYAAQPPRSRLLVAADAEDAGAERLLAAMEKRHEVFLLRREGDWVNLYRRAASTLRFERGVVIGTDAAALAQVEQRLREWLSVFAIESVHLRGSAASDGWLAGLAAGLEIPAA
jgi:GT2 family glycosyltransferase